MNIQEYTQQINDTENIAWFKKMLPRYLKENKENVAEIEHVIDYINSDECPEKLSKMSFKDVKHNAEKWTKRMQKKGQHIAETEEDIEVVLELDDDMRLVKLIGKAAFDREGYLMSHCVSSYYDKNTTDVYSLRDAENSPHCTLEVVSGDQIQQIKGKGNGLIHPRYINYVLQVLEYFGLQVRDSELNNLGYSALGAKETEWLQKTFKGVKEITFGGKRYVYNHSKLIESKGA